ncbi:MAG: Gfo/Idh/MocA family protein [Gemmatimonadales bacterium]
MTSHPVSLAFLGCGNITRQHSGTVAKVAPEVPRYFASRTRETADRYARELRGAGAFGSYADACNSPAVTVVMVCTPPDSHLELTLAALAAGKDVIVEKPAFFRAADVDQVTAAMRTSGRRVFVAENYYYKPLRAAVAAVIASGDLGEIRFVHLNAMKHQTVAGWRGDPTMAGGGALFEGGVHWINFMANIGLTLTEVHGFRPGDHAGPERSTLVVGRYAEGAVGTLHHSWEVPSLLKGLRLSRLTGTLGSATFESNGLVLFQRAKRMRLRFPGFRDIRGMQGMFRDFLGALRDGREPAMTLAMARRDLDWLEAAGERLTGASRRTD